MEVGLGLAVLGPQMQASIEPCVWEALTELCVARLSCVWLD